MRRFCLICLIAVPLILSGCSQPKSGKVEVEVIDGVEYVHNPSEPLHPNKMLSLEEELTFGEDERSEESMLIRPRQILVDQDDNIYISEYMDAVIKVFDKEGNYLRTFGQKGQGPGEFQSIFDMKFLPDERLITLDFRSRRTSIFNREGVFIDSHTWRNSHLSIYLIGLDWYVTEENFFQEGKLFIKKYDLDGKEIQTWGEFTPYKMEIRSSREGTISMGVPYRPQSVFAGDSTQGCFYHCLNDNYLIEVYDQDGKLFRKIDRPYDPVPFTQEDADEYYASVDRRQNPVFSDLAREIELPKVKTITDALGVDDRGYLWVATNEEKEEGGKTLRAYDIFDSQGQYDCRIWLDFTPAAFCEGKNIPDLSGRRNGIYDC